MKKIFLLFVTLLISVSIPVFMVGCGTRSSDSDSSSGSSGSSGASGRMVAVDDWIPLVQSASGASGWRYETHEMPESAYSHFLNTRWIEDMLHHHSEAELLILLRLMEMESERQAEMQMARLERIHEIQMAIREFVAEPEWAWDVVNITSYLAGTFVSSDWEHLYVLVVERLEAEAAEFLQFIADFEEVVVQWVEFTYMELFEMSTFIWDITRPTDDNNNPFAQHPGWGNDIQRFQGAAFDSRINRVVIRLLDYSEEEKELFRQEVIDSPMVVFADEVEHIAHMISWHFEYQ